MNRRNMIGLLAASPLLPRRLKAFIALPSTNDAHSANGPTSSILTPDPKDCEDVSYIYPGDPFEEWRRRPRYPLLESSDPTEQKLLQSFRSNRRIAFIYNGGDEPGSTRMVSVESIFKHKDSPHTYMAAYCHRRGAHRIYRTDRIVIPNNSTTEDNIVSPFSPKDLVICMDATPIHSNYLLQGNIQNYSFPNGFLEEGERYLIKSMILGPNGQPAIQLEGRPILFRGQEIAWSEYRFLKLNQSSTYIPGPNEDI